MGILWPVVGAGVVMIAVGICIIGFRTRLVHFTVRGQRQAFGDATRRVQRAATPRGLIAPGVTFVIIGLVAILMATLAPEAF